MEGVPDVQLWECVLKVHALANLAAVRDCGLHPDILLNHHYLVDSVLPNISQSLCHAQLKIFEDNEACIQLIIQSQHHFASRCKDAHRKFRLAV